MMQRVIWREKEVIEENGTDAIVVTRYEGVVINFVKEDDFVSAIVKLDTGKYIEVPIEDLNATD